MNSRNLKTCVWTRRSLCPKRVGVGCGGQNHIDRLGRSSYRLRTDTPVRAESWRICIRCCRPKQVLVPDLESAIGLDVLTARQGESDHSTLHHDSFETRSSKPERRNCAEASSVLMRTCGATDARNNLRFNASKLATDAGYCRAAARDDLAQRSEHSAKKNLTTTAM